MFRFSSNPHKQFLWWKLYFDSQLSRNLNVGVDAGCANMKNRDFFRTKTYIGIDPNAELLAEGLLKNPNVKTLNCKILDIPKGLKADFVVCVQVLVNSEFNTTETLQSINKLIKITNPGGVLIFNTSRATQSYVKDLNELLIQNFAFVESKQYGGRSISSKSTVLGAFLKSLLMLCSEKYRNKGGPEKTYFKCLGRY